MYATRFEKSWLPLTINTDFNYMKCCISGRKTNLCMQLVMIIKLFIVYLYTNC